MAGSLPTVFSVHCEQLQGSGLVWKAIFQCSLLTDNNSPTEGVSRKIPRSGSSSFLLSSCSREGCLSRQAVLCVPRAVGRGRTNIKALLDGGAVQRAKIHSRKIREQMWKVSKDRCKRQEIARAGVESPGDFEEHRRKVRREQKALGDVDGKGIFLKRFSLEREWIQLWCFLRDRTEFDSAFQLRWNLGFYARASGPTSSMT